MKLVSLLLAAAAAVATFAAQATTVTVGSLSRDLASNTIVDSMNGRDWLGFDVTKGLTYAQTLAAIGASGVFQGYSIAHNADAQLFVNAMAGGTNLCTVSGNGFCMTGSQDAEKVVGESYVNYRLYANSHDSDLAWFLSDNGTGQAVGIVEVATDDLTTNDFVFKTNEWSAIGNADFYATFSYDGRTPATIGWLLYREAGNTVPESGSLALVGLALFVAAGARRRARRV